MRVLPPPLRVTLPPPSITVSTLTSCCLVTVMVTGAAPQSKVTTPPFASAAASAASVQSEAEPLPTTVVGVETSAGWIGSGHVSGGGLIVPPVPLPPPTLDPAPLPVGLPAPLPVASEPPLPVPEPALPPHDAAAASAITSGSDRSA